MLSSPLASQLRPTTWDEIVGQDHLIGESGALLGLMRNNEGPKQSIILHGPPGTGKTTIARLFADSAVFVELSALNAGVSTVRDEITAAEKRRQTFDQRTVLFIDEIHRFAKNQQESLLAAVEAGIVTLVGATTEHPGTNVVRALLSRCLVFELLPLQTDEIVRICNRALTSGFLGKGVSVSQAAYAAIARHSNGDARKALNLLQAAAAQLPENSSVIGEIEIAATGIEKILNFDVDGSYHYDTISAFIKSVRGSDVDAALEYLALMVAGGEKPEFIGRRLMILAAEDIGLADPTALNIAVAANSVAIQVGFPEARIPLAEAAIYLALAPKSNSAYLAIDRALEQVQNSQPSVPLHLTSRGSDKYLYPHDSDPPIAPQTYRTNRNVYYHPGKQGFEVEIAQRLEALNTLLGKGKD